MNIAGTYRCARKLYKSHPGFEAGWGITSLKGFGHGMMMVGCIAEGEHFCRPVTAGGVQELRNSQYHGSSKVRSKERQRSDAAGAAFSQNR